MVVKKLTKTDILKKNLIKALEHSLGVVTPACKKVGCARETYYKYYKIDKEFAKACDSVEGIALDFAESQLHQQIRDNNPTSTIFYLKTKGKKRGYIERTENETTLKGGININTDKEKAKDIKDFLDNND